MNSPVKNSCSSEKLADLLQKGDYVAFIANLSNLPQSNPDWSYFHLLAIRVLVRQHKPMDALVKARQLSVTLVAPDLRKLAALESYYLDWLFNGRKQACLDTLKEELMQLESGKFNIQESLFIREMRLRLTGTELMLGIVDSRSKSHLIEAYELLIDDYADLGFEEETFDCVQHVIGILESKPFPAAYMALGKLRGFKKLEMIKSCPHKKAHLQAMIARVSLREGLQFGDQKEFKKQFKQACFLLNQLDVKLPFYRFLVEIGSVFLEYGDRRGKKLLIRAIRYLEALKNPQETKRACAVLISWLKLRGDHTAIASYLLKVEEPLTYRPTPVISHDAGKPKLRDLSLSCALVIAEANMLYHEGRQDEAISILEDWACGIKNIGDTLLTASLFAKLSVFYLRVDASLAEHKYKQAIDCYQRLGYLSEAIDLVSDRISGLIDQTSQKISGKDIEQELNQINSTLPVSLSTCSAESFANMYELASLAYLSIRRPVEALKFLKEAQMVYQEFGMKPRQAYNLLYQGQVAKCLMLAKELDGPYIEGILALKEAGRFFKWMNCQPGLRQAEEDSAELKTLSCDPESVPFSANSSNFHLEIIQKRDRETSLYQRFAKHAKAEENHIVLASLKKYLNQN